jgi:hypothetical protein
MTEYKLQYKIQRNYKIKYIQNKMKGQYLTERTCCICLFYYFFSYKAVARGGGTLCGHAPPLKKTKKPCAYVNTTTKNGIGEYYIPIKSDIQ